MKLEGLRGARALTLQIILGIYIYMHPILDYAKLVCRIGI